MDWIIFLSASLTILKNAEALLAQLSFPVVLDVESPDALTLSDPALQIVVTRHELLQQSLQLLIKQQPHHWWQWQQKCWYKAWKVWLIEQIHSNQGCLSDLVTAFSQHIQSHKERLNEIGYREKVQAAIQFIQTLIGNDLPEYQDIVLKSILEQLSTLQQEKQEKIEKNNITIIPVADALLQSFKEEVSAVLNNYLRYYHNQGLATPKKSFPDVIFLCDLISNSNDIVKFGEELNQRYQQPILLKWMPGLNSNRLRRNLRTVLDNPKYSLEQLKLAAQSQVDQAVCQKTDKLSESYSLDRGSLSFHRSWDKVESLSIQAQPLINNPGNSSSFFRNSSKFIEQSSDTLTVRGTAF